MKAPCTFSEFLRLARLRRGQGELSVARQLFELMVLFPFYGVGPGFYQMAGFWKRDVPWAHKKGHLGAAGYRKEVGRLNPLPYRKLSQNKLSEKAMLRLFHIPTPDYLGYFHEVAGQDSDGRRLCGIADLEGFLDRFRDGTRICFKPLEGWAGQGFEVVEVTRGRNGSTLLRARTSTRLTPERFKEEVIDRRHGGASVIEAYLEQHPKLASFNPSSVNTMRLWIVRPEQRNPRVVLGYLRIGRAGSLVDNQSSGGIVAPIDLASGTLQAAIDGLHRHEVFTAHPDHHAAIEGEKIPFFEESLALARRVLTVFPGVGFAGADVAVSPTGPHIIEINLSPDREGAAFVGKPSKPLLVETAPRVGV